MISSPTPAGSAPPKIPPSVSASPKPRRLGTTPSTVAASAATIAQSPASNPRRLTASLGPIAQPRIRRGFTHQGPALKKHRYQHQPQAPLVKQESLGLYPPSPPITQKPLGLYKPSPAKPAPLGLYPPSSPILKPSAPQTYPHSVFSKHTDQHPKFEPVRHLTPPCPPPKQSQPLNPLSAISSNPIPPKVVPTNPLKPPLRADRITLKLLPQTPAPNPTPTLPVHYLPKASHLETLPKTPASSTGVSDSPSQPLTPRSLPPDLVTSEPQPSRGGRQVSFESNDDSIEPQLDPKKKAVKLVERFIIAASYKHNYALSTVAPLLERLKRQDDCNKAILRHFIYDSANPSDLMLGSLKDQQALSHEVETVFKSLLQIKNLNRSLRSAWQALNKGLKDIVEALQGKFIITNFHHALDNLYTNIGRLLEKNYQLTLKSTTFINITYATYQTIFNQVQRTFFAGEAVKLPIQFYMDAFLTNGSLRNINIKIADYARQHPKTRAYQLPSDLQERHHYQ
ncbi:MAG: hypothetical protein AB7F28_01995 [Candidatus Margulisiibacteriota bacterium]